MMKIYLGVTLSVLVLMSTSVLANKIVILGNPVVLEKQGDSYSLPSNYKLMGTYYYVFVNGAQQVCYLEKQPELSALNIQMLNVRIRSSVIDLVCYPFDPNYFTRR